MSRSTPVQRATTGSREWNLHVLRRLYNKDQQGRGEEGVKARDDLHPTIRPITYLALTQVVPVGRGQYGSPVIELSLRIMLAAVGKIPVSQVAEEVAMAANDRGQIASNLMKLARLIADQK